MHTSENQQKMILPPHIYLLDRNKATKHRSAPIPLKWIVYVFPKYILCSPRTPKIYTM
jgi:hypothetical protein